jgi:hypothetical protein
MASKFSMRRNARLILLSKFTICDYIGSIIGWMENLVFPMVRHTKYINTQMCNLKPTFHKQKSHTNILVHLTRRMIQQKQFDPWNSNNFKEISRIAKLSNVLRNVLDHRVGLTPDAQEGLDLGELWILERDMHLGLSYFRCSSSHIVIGFCSRVSLLLTIAPILETSWCSWTNTL